MMQKFSSSDSNTVYETVTGIAILAYSLYSPNRALCDFSFFSEIKEKLRGNWFTYAEEAVAACEKTVEATQAFYMYSYERGSRESAVMRMVFATSVVANRAAGRYRGRGPSAPDSCGKRYQSFVYGYYDI
ncbi:hypothetical protein EVAR_64056_1 [Eumeta japonica]|uniref:Uncharacterized protein n=1 Tax=Eumeta variegata TaxID=151549 RepID=A0A4C2A061_EUMVA|nr:hypothetical protein EVAR_64056_1 [Eumeta japonica]